jgi:hypothetical protein
MITVQLSKEAVDALNEISRLRGITFEQAMQEAIGVDLRIAREWDNGTDVVFVNGRGQTRKLEVSQPVAVAG